MKQFISETNAMTGETVEREMTSEELIQFEKDVADHQAMINEEAAKTQAKSTLLAKLGITEDEAKLLLS